MVENGSRGPPRAIVSLVNSKTKGSCGVAPISKRAVVVLLMRARFGSIHKELGAGCQYYVQM